MIAFLKNASRMRCSVLRSYSTLGLGAPRRARSLRAGLGRGRRRAGAGEARQVGFIACCASCCILRSAASSAALPARSLSSAATPACDAAR